RVAAAKNQSAQETLADANRITTDLRLQLDQTTRAAQQATDERARAQALLDTAQKAVRSLQTRLDEATRAQNASAADAHERHSQDQATIADLIAQLDAARTAAIAHPPEN